MDTCHSEPTHSSSTHCAGRNCFLPHACFILLFDSASRLSTVTLRASSLAFWLLTRSCQGRCWVETGDRRKMETDLPSIFPQHLSLCVLIAFLYQRQQLEPDNFYSSCCLCCRCEDLLYPRLSLHFSYNSEKSPSKSPLLLSMCHLCPATPHDHMFPCAFS